MHKCLLRSTRLSGEGGEEREPLCTSQSFPPTAVWTFVFWGRNTFVFKSTTAPAPGPSSGHTGIERQYKRRWAGLWQICSYLHIYKLPNITARDPPPPLLWEGLGQRWSLLQRLLCLKYEDVGQQPSFQHKQIHLWLYAAGISGLELTRC